MKTHQSNISLWQDDIIFADLPKLSKNLSTEVCIVGAGFSGLLCAYQLLRNNFRVVILERDSLGFGESALTSAHLSDAFDDHFTEIIKKNGLDNARLAYQSHSEAIDLIERICREEKIDCDFKRVNAYLFLSGEDDFKTLEEELDAAHECAAMDAYMCDQAPEGFFETGKCICFPHQAQFHPLKFINGLSERVRMMGAQIFTNSRVVKVQDGKDAFVETDQGYRVSADHILMSTNVPVNNMMTVHMKEAAYRSYVIGMKVQRGSIPEALYWDSGNPYHYIRVDSSPERDFDILIVGGEDHRVGQEDNPEQRFQKIYDWVEKRLKLSEPELIYTWSGQILEPMDGLAYIGLNPGQKNIYVITGDSGQGITHGALASLLLTALMKGDTHRWARVYDPARFHLNGLGHFIKDNWQSGTQYADWIYRNEKDVSELLPGEGCVVSEGLVKVAVYRDHEGELHRLSAVCPHMGGLVKWNGAEETWDCPCHGSRFSASGEVLNGPALMDMSPAQQEANMPLRLRGKDRSTSSKKGSDIDLDMRGSR